MVIDRVCRVVLVVYEEIEGIADGGGTSLWGHKGKFVANHVRPHKPDNHMGNLHKKNNNNCIIFIEKKSVTHRDIEDMNEK